MGSGASSLEEELVASLPLTSERFIGLYNSGNVCFANAVLQVLFRCEPLRSNLVQWHMCTQAKGAALSRSLTLLDVLGELFWRMQTNQIRTGTQGADDFIDLVKERNELFQGLRQQDAQEFFSFVVNDLGETVQAYQKRNLSDTFRKLVCKTYEHTLGKTFVHANFEGTCTSTTTCRTCQNKTTRTEAFLDVSLEIGSESCSVAEGLRRFSRAELVEGFQCDSQFCAKAGTQPADKRIVLTRLPRVLVLHLKRFQYNAAQQRFVKLLTRVSFSTELKVWESEEPDVFFRLKGLVAHIGPGAARGHYISVVSVESHWFLFNDDRVRIVETADLQSFFEGQMVAYLLFYERVEK
jgi:ubiquitin C-terminal hydrolase